MDERKRNVSFEIIKNCVELAIKKFYKEDKLLFEFKTEEDAVCERSMAFRIGTYLQRILEEDEILKIYNVDSEYNRNFNHPKFMYKKTLAAIEKKYTYPDIIVHQRKNNENNLLIIEFKKGKPKKDSKLNDFEKLKYFTDYKKEYRYSYGMYIELHRNVAYVYVFENGKEMGSKYFRV